MSKSYVFSFLFIFGWWYLAFIAFAPENPPKSISFYSPKITLEHSTLSQFSRETLKQALMGDYDLMCKLMAEWDVDAELLEKEGVTSIQRLPREEYLEAFRLSRDLKTKRSYSYDFFPQTFFSAALLLALVDPSFITALPADFRKQISIYPPHFTERVHKNADPYHLEQALGQKQTIAFVAPYSQPTTISTLEKRGALLLNLPVPNSTEDLESTIRFLGKITEEEPRAIILSTFIRASIYSLDNRLKAEEKEKGRPLTIFLNYRTIFSLPSHETFFGHLLEHLKLNEHLKEGPLELEKLKLLQPHVLIVSTKGQESLPCFLPKCKVYTFEENSEQTLSQFFLLSYFDLCSILIESPT